MIQFRFIKKKSIEVYEILILLKETYNYIMLITKNTIKSSSNYILINR